MRKLIVSLIAVAVASAASLCLAGGPTPVEIEAKFSKLLKNTKVSSIKEAPVKGLYEVVAGPNVIYYSPEGSGFLIVGQILDSGGKNLTAELQQKVVSEFRKGQEKKAAGILKTLPLDKAVKIGNGANIVIEFTDPDCPYCRKVDEYLSKRSDITRYVFLNPLDALHPNARAKSAYVLASKDKAKALHEAFTGKLTVTAGDLSKYPAEARQIEENIQFGQKLGLQGTPMLFVNGGMVNGADLNQIQRLLK